MTAPTRRARGALLEVSIGRSESEEWADEQFRRTFLADVASKARAKGRRFYRVTDANGVELIVGEIL